MNHKSNTTFTTTKHTYLCARIRHHNLQQSTQNVFNGRSAGATGVVSVNGRHQHARAGRGGFLSDTKIITVQVRKHTVLLNTKKERYDKKELGWLCVKKYQLFFENINKQIPCENI